MATNPNSPTLTPDQYREHAKKVIHSPDALPGGKDITKHTKHELNVLRYQMYYNDIHRVDIWADWQAGAETINAISEHILATQVFLKELGAKNADGTPLVADGEMWSNTARAIKEYLGVDIEKGIALKIVDTLQDKFDEYKEFSDTELLTKLKEANTDLPEKRNDKRLILAEFTRRFREHKFIIRTQKVNNRFIIQDLAGKTINMAIPQQDLQIIMVLLSSTAEERLEKKIFQENIPNNVLDSVVKKFELKKENGDQWKGSDFDSDGTVVTQKEAEENKTLCLNDIDTEILKLEGKNKEKDTTDSQKEENRLWIQKLEVAKLFVRDKSVFSTDSLDFTRDMIQDEVGVAALAGDKEAQLSFMKQVDNWDMRKFLVNQGPRIIFSIFFALLASFLPKWFREVVMGYIGAVAGLWIYGDAKKAGLLPKGKDGDVNGVNSLEGTGPLAAWVESFTERMNEILTLAPNGLESRHRTMYARVVIENTDTQKKISDRKHLDLAFLYASQDTTLGQLDVSEIGTDKMTSGNVWSKVSQNTKDRLLAAWVKDEELLYTLRMLIKVNEDWKSDTKVQDLFVLGQASEVGNLPTTVWVTGKDAFNQNINSLVNQISGIGADAEDTTGSIKADVQRALAHGRPNFVERYLHYGVATLRADSLNVGNTTIDDVTEIIKNLDAVLVHATGTDKTHIEAIKLAYSELINSLKATEKVSVYLWKTDDYTQAFPGKDTAKWIVNSASEGITGAIAYFGFNPAYAPGTLTETTPEALIALINEGNAININSLNISVTEKKELQKQLDSEILKLETMLAALYGELANDTSISQIQRDILEQKWSEALVRIVNADPKKSLESLSQTARGMTDLWNEYNNIDDYATILYKHAGSLKWIKTLADLDVNQLSPEAQKVQQAAQSIIGQPNSIFNGFAKRIETKSSDLVNSIPTDIAINSVTTLEALDDIEKQYEKVQTVLVSDWVLVQARQMANEYLGILNGQTQAYNNVLDILENITKEIDATTTVTLGGAGAKSSLDRAKRTLDTKRASLEVGIVITLDPLKKDQIEDSQKVTDFIQSIDTSRKNIEKIQSNAAAKARKTEKIEAAISLSVDAMVEKLAEYQGTTSDELDKIGALSDIYDTFHTSVGNGGNHSFENSLAEIYAKIAEEWILKVTIGGLTPEVKELVQWYLRDVLLEQGILIKDTQWGISISPTHQNNPIMQKLTDDSTTMKDVKEIIDTMILATNSITIKDNRDKILTALWNSLDQRIVKWAKTKYWESKNYLVVLLDILTN